LYYWLDIAAILNESRLVLTSFLATLLPATVKAVFQGFEVNGILRFDYISSFSLLKGLRMPRESRGKVCTYENKAQRHPAFERRTTPR